MQNKVTYEYAIIRLVPRVERAEFLNVGVIVFSKRKRYLGVKYHLDTPRILAFAPDLDLNLIQKYLTAWEAICTGGKTGGAIGQLDLPTRFRWLVAPRSTMIQSSPIHPGLCSDPAQVLERLFAEYVL